MNIYLVVLLIIAVVLISNLATFGLVRKSRGMKINWLTITKDGISKPFQKEDDQLSELHQQIENLSQPNDQPDHPDP